MVLLRKCCDRLSQLTYVDLDSGLLTYTVLNGATAIIKLVSRGYLVPVDEDLKEYWTCKFSPYC